MGGFIKFDFMRLQLSKNAFKCLYKVVVIIIRSYTPSCIRSLGLLVSCQMHLKVCFMVRIGVTDGKFEFS